MKGNQALQERIQRALDSYSFPLFPERLYEPIRYLLSLGAKRMRPQLLLMGCELFNGDPEQAVQPALGIEFFHNFTLMHDDIMDQAPLRRARQTVHEKWNTNIAILSGDAMFVQSFQLMMQVEAGILKSVLDLFSRTAIEVCEGQQMDMDFETADGVSLEEYLRMIELKTAVLLAASLQIGSLIAGARKQDSEHLYQFGKLIGTGFQLQDDYLDVYGDSDKFGKQVGGDILSNKKTFLLLKAQQLADPESLRELRHLMQHEKHADEKVRGVKAIYDRLGVQDHSNRKIEACFDTGLKHLEAIDVPDSQKEDLVAFANMLMAREK